MLSSVGFIGKIEQMDITKSSAYSLNFSGKTLIN